MSLNRRNTSAARLSCEGRELALRSAPMVGLSGCATLGVGRFNKLEPGVRVSGRPLVMGDLALRSAPMVGLSGCVTLGVGRFNRLEPGVRVSGRLKLRESPEESPEERPALESRTLGRLILGAGLDGRAALGRLILGAGRAGRATLGVGREGRLELVAGRADVGARLSGRPRLTPPGARRASLLDTVGRERDVAEGVGRVGLVAARDDPRSTAADRPGAIDPSDGRWRPRDGASAASVEMTLVRTTKMATHPPMEPHQLW